MFVRRLWLADFRSYVAAEVAFAPGLTAVLGPNGRGKTNLLEALAWLATLSSFRGAPNEALIRDEAPSAIIRAEAERDGRALLLEAELMRTGRNRLQINRQPVARSRDLLGALRVSVFAPDDLELVKGGPGGRREFLDTTLVALNAKYHQLQADVDRILRQRGALLKQSGGRLDAGAALTLDVWDAKLTEAGEELVRARLKLVDRLRPVLTEAYRSLSTREDSGADVDARYDAPWFAGGLAAALEASRPDELRRGVNLVGPHRDELVLTVAGRPARTHASQGEQRGVALALRLAAHSVVTGVTGSAPVLLLDDVFSELDPDRSDALLAHLPDGQRVLTSAAGLPPRAVPDLVVQVSGSVLAPEPLVTGGGGGD